MANLGTETRQSRSAIWCVAAVGGLTLMLLAVSPARAESAAAVPAASIDWKSETAIASFRSMDAEPDCTAPGYGRLSAADDVAAMVASVEGRPVVKPAVTPAAITVVATK